MNTLVRTINKVDWAAAGIGVAISIILWCCIIFG